MSPLQRLGGRKYAVTMCGLFLLPVLAVVKADANAYNALAVMVLSFCGGNAVVEWRHGGTK